MTNIITVLVSFYDNPSQEQLDVDTTNVITTVDNYCSNSTRSYIVNSPTEEQLEKKHYNYEWEIEVDNCSVSAQELFDLLLDISFHGGKLLLVDVKDKRYSPKLNNSNKGYYWTNEGETWYHDSEKGYRDAYWDFHVNNNVEYTVVHIPTFVRNMNEVDKQRYLSKGYTFMWRSTCCWDMWMQATTVEDALEEFEVMYKEKLWQTIEGYKKSLDKATDAFREFDKYRWNKKW